MVHGILQFTLRIAFRCVLHRYESQDIRCTQLSLVGYSGQADCISTLDWFCLVLMLIETNLLTPEGQQARSGCKLMQPLRPE